MTRPDLTGTVPAATVIIARDGVRGLEVLAIERAKGMGFAGGAVAFPGGKVDASDVPEGPAFSGFDVLDVVDATARISAAREAFEEAGILLSRGEEVEREVRAKLRPASDRHEIAFSDLLLSIGHVLSADVLKPFARWVPPLDLHKRFDTHFFLARLPEGETMLADGHEAVHARWVKPSTLIDEAVAGRISLLFPTRCNIARLAQFDSVDSLMADATPPPFIQPAVVEEGFISIPEGLGYPYTREPIANMRRA
ncbi:NUDIX hydrolase [Sandaracinobacteroides sp. A072]|uniref:NUDIX hydrolase n=1 Tax=Sandaracinobacteroides sp. A072 TaxID=3461146 RepID=UPI0040436B5C